MAAALGTPNSIRVLFAVGASPGVSTVELAKALAKPGKSPNVGSVTKTLVHLRRHGLIDGYEGPGARKRVGPGRRVHSIRLSPKGERVLSQLMVLAREFK